VYEVERPGRGWRARECEDEERFIVALLVGFGEAREESLGGGRFREGCWELLRAQVDVSEVVVSLLVHGLCTPYRVHLD
jgi:hypothetical protein